MAQVYVSTYVSAAPLDIFKETKGHFPAGFVETKNRHIFNETSGRLQPMPVETKASIFNKTSGRLQPCWWRTKQVFQVKP